MVALSWTFVSVSAALIFIKVPMSLLGESVDMNSSSYFSGTNKIFKENIEASLLERSKNSCSLLFALDFLFSIHFCLAPCGLWHTPYTTHHTSQIM
jgi:hypothetical protein